MKNTVLHSDSFVKRVDFMLSVRATKTNTHKKTKEHKDSFGGDGHIITWNEGWFHKSVQTH